MTNSKYRLECVICDSKSIENIIELKKMPLFMGANKGSTDKFSDMTFQNCKKCGNVQIKEIIDPNILYQNNHNIDTVGYTWIQHYKEFSEFALNDVINKNVLEIGDPSFKISSLISSESNKWNIVEMNPSSTINKPSKVNIINKYFDENFENDFEVDVVIHSHFLEHVVNPIQHLKQIFSILKNGGQLIFSIPNLYEILKSIGSPNSVLHFEHTYFYTEQSMINLLKTCGFGKIETQKYNNHSIFFKCNKKDVVKIENKHQEDIKTLFIKKHKEYKKKVLEINEKIKNKNSIYLYGCHVSSQFLINIGLKIENIKYILDNSESKTDYKLYGTQIVTKRPEIIKNQDDAIVIVFHTGIYASEISNQLKEINNRVILL